MAAIPRGAWADWILALVLAGLALFEIWVEPIFRTGLPGPRGAMSALAILATLPVAWRRSRPLPVLAALIAGLLGLGLVGDPDRTDFEALLALLVATYSVAGHGSRDARVLGAALVVAGGSLYVAVTYRAEDAAGDVLVPLLLLAGAWLVGIEVHRQRSRALTLAERTSRLDEERRRLAQEGAARERARIARELHDAVAHSVGLAVMHVGAARLALGEEQPRSRELLLTAEARGREALAETRRMLGVLRSSGDETLAPAPSLRRVDALAERLRRAGLDVSVRIEGEPVRLPPGLDASAYRILQEALTNALKHGDGGRATVRVSYRLRELGLAVHNPIAAVNGSGPGDGHGLVGIDERVRLFDGSVRAGRNGDEWQLVARLPIGEAGG